MSRAVRELDAVVTQINDRYAEVGLDPLFEDQVDCLIKRARYDEARGMIEMMRDFGYLPEELIELLLSVHADLHRRCVADSCKEDALDGAVLCGEHFKETARWVRNGLRSTEP